jgi:Domain of unknown function (DUF4331)
MTLRGAARTGAIVSLLGVSALALYGHRSVGAADHLDPPARTDPAVDPRPDIPADIADVFAWYTSSDFLVALTFAGPQPANQPPFYDRDVLYAINVSNDGDPVTTEFQIEFRFAQDGANNTGVMVTGLPAATVISGPVETTLQQNGILVRAGLFDDPFFFDLQGFRETRSTGALSFNNQRDFFAGQNDTAVVIQIPRALIQNGNRLINVWASTARFGGQL